MEAHKRDDMSRQPAATKVFLLSLLQHITAVERYCYHHHITILLSEV